MYADVERFRFDAAQHYLRVVQQQGRVMMAAEANEQVAILLRHLQTLAVDLFGRRGTSAVPDGAGFKAGPGFAVKQPATAGTGVSIQPGHYWVDGKLCEQEEPGVGFTEQVDFPLPAGVGFPRKDTWVVYLDVWERHVGAAEEPGLVEVALGGPDTCSRTKLVWQAKLLAAKAGTTATQVRDTWVDIERGELGVGVGRGRLTAEVDRQKPTSNPCLAAPTAGYTGGENQLIRVEVHSGGKIGADPKPTFKWAFDNASVAHRLQRVNGTSVVFSEPPRDIRKGFDVGTRVELLSAHQVLRGEPGMLTTVQKVDDDRDDYELTLAKAADFALGDNQVAAGRWALLRRWDHTTEGLQPNGARLLEEGEKLALADGVVIAFTKPATGETVSYRPGDYWTTPVRVAIGDVIWPHGKDGKPKPMPPEGVDHSYAPLAVLTFDSSGIVSAADARHFIKPIGTPA
jgi:hypothetical protein